MNRKIPNWMDDDHFLLLRSNFWWYYKWGRGEKKITFSKYIVRKLSKVPTIRYFISNIFFETIDCNLAKKLNSYRYPDEVADFLVSLQFMFILLSYHNDNLALWMFPMCCWNECFNKQQIGKNTHILMPRVAIKRAFCIIAIS